MRRLLDAELDIFSLSSPYMNIVANLQTVYVRAEYEEINPIPNNTGCFTIVELDLVVLEQSRGSFGIGILWYYVI